MRPGLRRWHRRFGIAAALFLSWLAASGIALNHGHLLGLDRVQLHAGWLMRLYGLDGMPSQGFVAGEHRLVGGTTLDDRALQPQIPQAIGLAEAAGMLIVATPSSLVLLTPAGERIEELRAPTLPVTALSRLGVLDGRVVIEAEGKAWSSADGESWTGSPVEGVSWSEARDFPAGTAQASVTAEQALIDAHSGRLFGPLGPLFMDLVALAALALAATGTIVWWRSRPRPSTDR